MSKILKLFLIMAILPFNFATAMEPDSIKVETKNLGIEVNSIWADFAPIISNDGATILFTSRRPFTEKELKSGKSSKERIYTTSLHPENNTWSKPVVLESAVNAPGRNNSAISLSLDGKKLLLFRDDIKGNGDIYESTLIGGLWSEAIKLPEPINTSFHESSACYSSDGNTIYFVSNRKGGIGGRDIWFCIREQTGSWGKATNLGNTINTSNDEESVFISNDGKNLYFSSKSHQSTGGYDVLKSEFTNGSWTTPVNMGKPINSARNDIFFVLESNGFKGYYASSAVGGTGEEDIFQITFSPIEKPKAPIVTLLKGIIFDESSKTPLDATIEIIDLTTGKIISPLASNSETGQYEAPLDPGSNYGINVTSSGYLFYTTEISVPVSGANFELEKNIGLRKLEVGTKIVLNNIFYDFNKSTLRNESLSELDRLLTLLVSNGTIKIELSSHTDGLGSDAYNIKLSLARAQSVVEYLKEKGIDKNRLTAKGYGKSNPVATNDTEEGRQLNRRTEFSIMSK